MYYRLSWIDEMAGPLTEWFFSEDHARQVAEERNLIRYDIRAVFWPFSVEEEKKNAHQHRTPDGELFTGEKAFILNWLNRGA